MAHDHGHDRVRAGDLDCPGRRCNPHRQIEHALSAFLNRLVSIENRGSRPYLPASGDRSAYSLLVDRQCRLAADRHSAKSKPKF